MRLVLLSIALVAACSYELAPISVAADAALPDAGGDFSHTADGPICPNGSEPFHIDELSESPLTNWGAEAIAPLGADSSTSVQLDTTQKVAGAASVLLTTMNGQAGLFYPKTRDANFDVSRELYLGFSVTADNPVLVDQPAWQGAQPHVLLVTDSNNYFEFIPLTNRLPRNVGVFSRLTVPLLGEHGWIRNRIGSPDLSKVRYFAITFDSWSTGFQVWVDDLRFGPTPFLDCVP